MSGRGYAERNLPSFFANSFSPLDLFKADCEAEESVQGLHLVSLMKDTGLEKDSPTSSVPRVCYEPPTSSTSEAGLFDLNVGQCDCTLILKRNLDECKDIEKILKPKAGPSDLCWF